VFLLIFSLQTFAGSIIIVDYYVEKAAYLKNCENTLRTAMKCNGKCQMFKKLKQTEQDEKFPEKKFGFKQQDLSSRSFFLILGDITVTNFTFYPSFNSAVALLPNGDIFHPPSGVRIII
jgi:hypothetical protein